MNYDQDPELVSIWLKARLLESTEIKGIVGTRIYDDVADMAGKDLPLLYFTGDSIDSVVNFGGTNRVMWQYDIRGVWDAALTGPSRAPARALSKAMKRVLCDTSPYRAEVPGVGWIWECKWLRWYRPPKRVESGKTIIEHGITIFLITS